MPHTANFASQLGIGDWNATSAARIGAALLHMASHKAACPRGHRRQNRGASLSFAVAAESGNDLSRGLRNVVQYLTHVDHLRLHH